MAIRLALLEFGELPLPTLLETAKLAEALGFSRYWLTEHRGLIENALLLTPLVASVTSRIRVGPAGVLLRYQLAESVAAGGILLAQAFPGRIDLGLAGGRHAVGADEAFLDGRTHLYAPDTFDDKARAVAQRLAAHEVEKERPELWMLAASESAARGQLAARASAHFCLSLMHSAEPPSPAALVAFREEEKRLRTKPRSRGLAVLAACIESPRGRRRYETPFPGLRGPVIVESAAICRERIEALGHEYDVDEVAVLLCAEGVERRFTSMRMLMEAFGAPPPRRRAGAGARG